MYNIVLYKDAHGNCPMKDFMFSLDMRAKSNKRAAVLLKKILYTMDLLKAGGTRCGEKFTKQVEGKLWELRPDDHRIFFFMWNGNNLVLLHSFRKTTKKTPSLEIAQAKREMNDWIMQHER
jgi:phage-related protein